ncbi:MAG: hypothetical protein CVT49_03755 [candidate division Zixibacteria bacterium HGW-Zixibacteria-1]|nr:MAG: hypothetical protein CVT49_03755 [candidate division Zixibacteria bacterium HGW-Zixibacteria-1]
MRRRQGTDLIIIGMLLVILAAPAAFAQRPGKGMHGGGWGKHADNLENLRLLKLLEVLDLDEQQNSEFIALFASFRKESRDIREKIDLEVEGLIKLLKIETPPEEAVKEKVEKIQALKREMINSFDTFFDNSKKILTVIQQGKMIVFQERFERELIESVRGFRKDEPHDKRP